MAKRVSCCLLVALTLLGGMPSFAHAADAAIHWSDCGAAGTRSRTFACNTNSGAELAVISFQPRAGNAGIVEMSTTLTLGQVGSDLPDWWRFALGGCRTSAVNGSMNFLSATGPCTDYWAAQATLAIAHSSSNIAGVVGRIQLTGTLPAAAAHPLDPGVEYYGIAVVFSHQRTVGAGSCGGCETPICLALGTVRFTGPTGGPAPDVWYVAPSAAANHVLWNGATRCDGLTPVLNRTWGQLKSLYR